MCLGLLVAVSNQGLNDDVIDLFPKSRLVRLKSSWKTEVIRGKSIAFESIIAAFDFWVAVSSSTSREFRSAYRYHRCFRLPGSRKFLDAEGISVS